MRDGLDEATRSAEGLRLAVSSVLDRSRSSVAGPTVVLPDAECRTAPAGPTALPGITERRRLAERGLEVATWVRNVGVVIVLFVVWQLWGTALAQHRSQAGLAASFAERQHTGSATTGHAPGPGGPAQQAVPVAAVAPRPPPAEGQVVARIEVPILGIDQYVVEGTGVADLRKGPGHYIGTPLPGEPGNVAIAGHRTTYGAPFYDLNELVPGQTIIVSTPSGLYRYVVSEPPFPVDPGNSSVLRDFGDNRLTLTTCNPRYSAAQRLIVVARPVVPPPPRASAPAKAVRVHTVASPAVDGGSVGWHPAHLPLALLAVAMVVLLGMVNTRLRRDYGRAMSLAVRLPLWAGGLYLLFQALAALLPSNL